MMQVVIDKVPNMDIQRDRDTPGGIFHEGCLTAKEIFEATRFRDAPFELIPPHLSMLRALVTQLLEKKRSKRPSAIIALKDPWFTDEDGLRGPSKTWSLADA